MSYGGINKLILIVILAIISGTFCKIILDDIYSVEFEILEYINKDGRLLNGNCCSGYKSTGLCRGGNSTCKPYWKVCLTSQQTQSSTRNTPVIIPTERQRDRRQTTPKPSLIRNVLSKLFGAPIVKVKNNTLQNDHATIDKITNATSSCTIAFWTTNIFDKNLSFPITVRSIMPKKLTDKIKEYQASNNKYEENQLKRMLILVEIWHSLNADFNDNDKLIYRYIETRNITIDDDVSNKSRWEYGGKTKKQNSLSNSTNGIQFEYRWRILPSSLSELQINDTSVTQNCPQGWSGELCDTPICMEGCDPNHGYCEKPGECKCRFGWAGMNCNYCVTMPGCVHGNCVKPLECRCEDGWTGMFCSSPKCKTGCDPVNGFCSVPGECKCRFGWQGDSCSECSTLPGCQHGGCNEPLDCNCFDGWEGMFCSTPKCSVGCDERQGWCRRPNECRCKVGFTGTNCTECVPYPGCENGNCDGTPWTCSCKPGWGGITCSERLNWCELNKNPCQNEGTCISVENADGSYICQCVVGYGGKHCEKMKN